MAGESARREHERIRDGRRERLRGRRDLLLGGAGLMVLAGAVTAHLLLDAWWLGALLAAIMVGLALAPSQREAAWRKGAEGEVAVGRALDALAPPAVALHDRRIPRSRANIDHVLLAPTGVWTIDAKNYTGRIETRGRGRELWVKGRNRSKLLDQARGQAEVVRKVLGDAGLGSVPVQPALCFLGVEWPLLSPPRAAGDVHLVSRRGLRRLVDGQAVLTAAQIQRIRDALDQALHPAAPPEGRAGAHPGGRVAAPTGGRAAAPSEPAPAASRREPRPAPSDVTVNPWKGYGKHRLYVNGPDGTALGYVDLDTNEVVPAEERHRQTILDAVARYLRSA